MLFWFIFPVWKTDGGFRHGASVAGPRCSSDGNLPQFSNGADERPVVCASVSERVVRCCLEEEIGIFHVGIVRLLWKKKKEKKKRYTPGVVERKICHTADFWSGKAPAKQGSLLFSSDKSWIKKKKTPYVFKAGGREKCCLHKEPVESEQNTDSPLDW